MTAEAELADLQKRFALLEGERKSYYETSKWAIMQNRETVAQVRKENKDLRKALSLIAKDRAEATDPSSQSVKKASEQMFKNRKEVDVARAKVLERQRRLHELQDKIQTQEKEVVAPQTDTPVNRQLRSLENRLDKAYIKYNEAMSIKKTYEQIVKRLREERLTFDSQLAAVERTLRAKEQDYMELLHLLHDANHAKEIAKMELGRYEAALSEERRAREKEIQERRNVVKQQALLQQKNEDRERRRKDVIMEAWEEAGPDERPKTQGRQSAVAEQRKAEDEAQLISTFDEAFRKIKEATGVSDINDVLEKFMTAEETYNSLSEQSKDCQKTIETLQEEKTDLKKMVEELKFSGAAVNTVSNRRAVDDMESKIGEATGVLNRNNQKYHRIARVLVNVKAGIEHLVDKLDAVKVDVGPYTPTDDIVVDLVTLSEQKLTKLLQLVHAQDDDGEVEAKKSSASLASTGLPPAMAANNVRIKIHTNADDELPVTDSEDEGLQEEVLDRSVLKKQASLMEEKQKRKAKKTTTRRKREARAPEQKK
eukprot:Rmarinus@m.7515